MDKRNRLDIHSESSDRPGMLGVVESFLRKFKFLAFVIYLVFLFALVVSSLGFSLAPAIYFFSQMSDIASQYGTIIKSIILGISLATSYFIYGFCLIFVIPAFNFLLPLKLSTFTGNWYSMETLPWYTHNALTYMVRFTFLDFITPTPLNVLFFRMMGMKIGKGVMINTTYISDPCMITIEDYVTVGGSVTIFAHYGQKGILVIKPVIIRKGVTVGLKASIMGDVEIGEGAVVPPHSVLLPKTRFPGKRDMIKPVDTEKSDQDKDKAS